MDTLLLVSDQVYFYEFNSQKCFSACKWRTVRQSFHFQKIVGTLKTIFLKFANMCFPFKSINTHNKEKEKLKNVKTFYFRLPPISEAMRQAKNKHLKVKFWNWCPITIWHSMKCVQFFSSQKSLHPSLQ